MHDDRKISSSIKNQIKKKNTDHSTTGWPRDHPNAKIYHVKIAEAQLEALKKTVNSMGEEAADHMKVPLKAVYDDLIIVRTRVIKEMNIKMREEDLKDWMGNIKTAENQLNELRENVESEFDDESTDLMTDSLNDANDALQELKKSKKIAKAKGKEKGEKS